MKYIIFFLTLCSAFSANAEIKNIPAKDLENIKCLFKNLIEDHDYSYTIFGSKPMSLADFCLEIPQDQPFYNRIKSRFFISKRKACLASWYKFRHELNLKDFIFLDKETDLFDCLVLVLINKRNMSQILQENEMIFKAELGETFNPKLFLEKLEKREISLAKAIHDNDKLLGIMLGYGVRNSSLFQERYDLTKAIAKRKKEKLQHEELLEKLNTIETQVDNFSELEEEAIIPPLYFLADTSHPETLELRKKYALDRKKIEPLMGQANFPELILQHLLAQ